MGDEKPSMAGLASSFSTEVTLADTVMKPTVAHASWAFLDVIDKTTVLQYSSPLIVLGVAWFIYVFLAGPLYRKIEEFIARRLSDEHTYCVVAICLHRGHSLLFPVCARSSFGPRVQRLCMFI